MVHVVGLLFVLVLGSSPPAGSNPAATMEVSRQTVAPGSSAVAKALADAVALSQALDLGGPGVVFLVRHAERADAGMAAAKMAGADPELSDAGKARAAALAALLKDA